MDESLWTLMTIIGPLILLVLSYLYFKRVEATMADFV